MPTLEEKRLLWFSTENLNASLAALIVRCSISFTELKLLSQLSSLIWFSELEMLTLWAALEFAT